MTGEVSWPDAFLDHYARFLGQPSGAEIYRHTGLEHGIQILRYDQVFPDCKTYCTLGFSHYSPERVAGTRRLSWRLTMGSIGHHAFWRARSSIWPPTMCRSHAA